MKVTGDPASNADTALTLIEDSLVGGSVDITGSAGVVVAAIDPTLTTTIGKSLTIKDSTEYYVDSLRNHAALSGQFPGCRGPASEDVTPGADRGDG